MVEVKIPKSKRKARFMGEDSEGEGDSMEYASRRAPASESPKREKAKKGAGKPMEERAYKLVTKFDDLETIKRLVARTEGTVIENITVGDLMSMSPMYAKGLRASTGRTRQPLKPIHSKGVLHQESAFPYMEDDDLEVRIERSAISLDDLPLVDSFYIATEEDEGLIPGSCVATDPYLQYLSNLPTGEAPKQVYSAGSSASLRVIHPLVAGQQHEECVVDSGSQIVSMALALAEELGITWDPDTQIYMQSANGQLKKTAGLARNVAFRFGDITIYLQIHIIDQPAYRILLGRPFDVITQSQIDNRRDGSQTITITDPHNDHRCVMPTRTRGTFSAINKVKKVEELYEPNKPQKVDQNQLRKVEREADFQYSFKN